MEDDPTSALIARMKEIFDDQDKAFLLSKTFVKELNDDPGAWWYPMNEKKLAGFLRAFHVRPEQHRTGQHGRGGGGRGYWRAHLEERVFTHA
jgi:hypothetical protein